MNKNKRTICTALLFFALTAACRGGSDLIFGGSYSLLHIRTQPDIYPMLYDNGWSSPANLGLHLVHSTAKFRSHSSISFSYSLLELSNAQDPFMGKDRDLLCYRELRYALQTAYLRKVLARGPILLSLGVNILASLDFQFEAVEGAFITKRVQSLIPALRTEFESVLLRKTSVAFSIDIPPLVYRRVQNYSNYSYRSGENMFFPIYTRPYLSAQGGIRSRMSSNTVLELFYIIVLENAIQNGTYHRRLSELVRLGVYLDL